MLPFPRLSADRNERRRPNDFVVFGAAVSLLLTGVAAAIWWLWPIAQAFLSFLGVGQDQAAVAAFAKAPSWGSAWYVAAALSALVFLWLVARNRGITDHWGFSGRHRYFSILHGHFDHWGFRGHHRPVHTDHRPSWEESHMALLGTAPLTAAERAAIHARPAAERLGAADQMAVRAH